MAAAPPPYTSPGPSISGMGVRYSDPRIRFLKHATIQGTPEVFTRPWGSQPMEVDLETGMLTGKPLPEPVPDLQQAWGR